MDRGRDREERARSQWSRPGNPLPRWSQRLLGMVVVGALLGAPMAHAQESPPVQSDRVIRPNRRVIIRQSPVIIRQPPIIIVPYPRPNPQQEQVRVEFDARGRDWGAVYLNNRLVYRPHNHDRQKTLYLPPGGYRLEITGVVRSDVWANGYLDLGRDSSRLVVIRFSKAEGVTVSGSPYVWIPD